MRVLLIEPPFSENQVHVRGFGLAEPLALEMLAGNLRHHDVRILDMRLHGGLRRELEDFQPDVVGAGCYATGLYVTKRVFREVKACRPEALTVVGGHHASLIPQEFLDPNIDLICIGEGDVTLRELVDTHEANGDLGQVAGLGIRRNGGLAFTAARPLINLDEAPLPDRSLVAKDRHRYFRGAWRPIVSVATERGCPFRCHFCSMWKINQGKYRVRSAELVADEIASLPERYVDFVDDNTLHDVPRAHRLADLLREKGVRKIYKAYARSDTVARHPDLIEKWRDVGLKLVLIGLESFREQDLQAYGKRNSIRNNEEAIRVLHANGVELVANFVINPDYTREDFESLAQYVRKWDLTHPVFTILTPLPGTDFFESVRDKLVTQNYEFFDFFHCVLQTALPAREFARCYYELWKKTYSPGMFLKKLGQGKVAFSPRQILAFREFMRDVKAQSKGAE